MNYIFLKITPPTFISMSRVPHPLALFAILYIPHFNKEPWVLLTIITKPLITIYNLQFYNLTVSKFALWVYYLKVISAQEKFKPMI